MVVPWGLPRDGGGGKGVQACVSLAELLEQRLQVLGPVPGTKWRMR